MENDDIFTRVNREYFRLTGSEKRIADFIMLRQQNCQFLSISELAEQAGVAEATVSRFSRRLGYAGYNAMKLSIASSVAGRPAMGEVYPDGSDRSIMISSEKLAAIHTDTINQTRHLVRPDVIRRTADILIAAKRILCMGQGVSMVMAEEMADLFSTVLPNLFAVKDSHHQAMRAATLGEGDAVFYFSHSGNNPDLMDVLRVVKERGARSIIMTRFSNSVGAVRADVVLECGSRESPMQQGSVSARMAQLYLLDVLYAEICRREAPGLEVRRKLVTEALAAKHAWRSNLPESKGIAMN